MQSAEPILRQAGRVLVIDPAGRVFASRRLRLLPSRITGTGFTIGGGLDEDEEATQAALRELREEAGIVAALDELAGPVWHRSTEFSFEGTCHRQEEDAAQTTGPGRRAPVFQLYCCAIPLYRPAVDAGDVDAAQRLAALLAWRGDLDEMLAQAGAGDDPATRRLAEVLAQRGDLDELRARSRGFGDRPAAWMVARLVTKHPYLDELRVQADTGDWPGARLLDRMVEEHPDLDELRARADTGDVPAAMVLAEVLARRGDLDELWARAETGDVDAARPLAGVLARQGRDEEAERLRRFGLNPDGSIACA
jgi:8-oxo-dGTP pyrophosphatase MutT (NUDIX family)